MQDEIARLRQEAEHDVVVAETAGALEEVRRIYLGRRGRLAVLFDRLPQLPESERRAAGQALNEVRAQIEERFPRRAAVVAGRGRSQGRRHILSRTVEEVQEIFIRMGFDLVDGSEVETDECNFEHLNIPRDHPARDTMDTFYISDELLLRTHTTVVDARIMRERRPPMRVLAAGRCSRRGR